jgi:hypothetical protein
LLTGVESLGITDIGVENEAGVVAIEVGGRPAGLSVGDEIGTDEHIGDA